MHCRSVLSETVFIYHRVIKTCRPENHIRGITLINITAKYFSLAFTYLINTWCERQQIFTENRVGFRNCHSNADAIFILHSLIEKVLSKNGTRWCILYRL